MVYLVTNITDSTNNPIAVKIGDIPNRHIITILPGHSIDLEVLSTRNQIEQSVAINVLLQSGHISVDIFNSPQKRWFVDAIISGGNITVDTVELNEPIAISAFVGGVETSLSATNKNNTVGLNVFPILPKVPTIANIVTVSSVPVSYTLPNDSRKFLIKAKGCSQIELAYTSGGDVITIPRGNSYEVTNIDCSNITLFMKANKDDVIEIESWKYL